MMQMCRWYVIGVLDQLDVLRRLIKVGQMVIEERWRGQNSALCHSCLHSSFSFSYFSQK